MTAPDAVVGDWNLRREGETYYSMKRCDNCLALRQHTLVISKGMLSVECTFCHFVTDSPVYRA